MTEDQTIALTPSALPTMPPEIAKAIVSVMAKIKPLSKDMENKFQKYNYVSVDQFFDAVGRLMADAGIFVMAFENTIDISKQSTTDDYGKTKESVWMSAVYDLYIYHSTGSSYGPIKRSMRVSASGAQSYASAMSFVEKYFLRSLFKIPTGDMDEDGQTKENLPVNRQARHVGPPAPPPQPPMRTNWKFDFPAYRIELQKMTTIEAIDSFDAKVRAKYGKQMSVADHEEADAILREVSSRLEEDSEP